MTFQVRSFTWCSVVAAVLNLLATGQGGFAADNQNSSAEKQRKLIAVLQSDAPPAEKAITCKRLAIYGTKDAVPALAPLLSNKDLASWARIALEAIPDPAAGDVLREAMGRLQGNLLIGVINSISARRDAKAVIGLTAKLPDSDPEVASAAAEALGQIGGTVAARSLDRALAGARTEVRSMVAYGCIICAERFLAQGKTAEAMRLYDDVRKANVPKQRLLEATRGAILARKSDGIPLLLEQLRSEDKALLNVGLGVARELPGRDATQALVSELERASGDRQELLLRAVVDRRDATVVPRVLQMAQNGPKQLRTAALGLLDRFGDVACVPVLLTAAAENDAEMAASAKAALARLEAKGVDADLLARLPLSSKVTRQVLIEIIGKRRIDGAVPAIMPSAEDADPAVRHAALDTIGLMGEAPQAADLARLLQKFESQSDREDTEKAMVAVCGRGGAKCLPAVLPLAQNADSALRRTALHALSSIGGAEALAAVKTAMNDQDEAVQDEAVRTLCNWPNNWPEDAGVAEPLLELAKSGKKTSHQIQGLRGYLQYLQEDKKLDNAGKLARVNELLPSIKRPEEKRLTISAISNLPTGAVLEPLITLAEDPAVAEEASLAIVKVATSKDQKDASKDLRRKALQTAIDKSRNEATRKKAEDALKQIN